MKRKLLTFLVTSLVLVKLQAFQIPTATPRIGDIAYGGTGCPGGTASLVIGQDSQVEGYNLYFEKYFVSTEGREFARASCNVTIPIQIPKGYALVLPQIELEGFSKLQAEEEGKVSIEVFWAGVMGKPQSYLLNNNSDSDLSFTIVNPMMGQTPCGASINLRVNTSVLLKGHDSSGSFINVDHLRIELPLNLVACEN